MPNMNFDVLKENISSLMKENNMTQQQLGDVIGISQSNVNKCLKCGDNSRSFTLEQVCAIADHFDKTIDELIGRNQESRSLSSESICSFFMNLISHYTVVHFDHEVMERVPGPYLSEYGEPEYKDKAVKYDAFYFPNHVTPPKYFDEFRLDELESEVRINGNELPENIRINKFLQKYIEAFEKHDSGIYDKETYNILVDAYRKILNK